MARRYVRDARGRFASKGVGGVGGYQGQTSGRGARLKTPGNVRAGGGAKQKLSAKSGGTISKPKGLKPQSSRKLKTGVAASRLKATNAKMANQPDNAQVSVRGRYKGRAGKRMDASIERTVKSQSATARTADKARNRQFKSDQSRAKKLRTVHEKAMVAKFSKSLGKSPAEIRETIRGMEPSRQIKFIKQFVKENRKRK